MELINKPLDGNIFVYALCDPISKEPNYVGVTTLSLQKRLTGHIAEASRSSFERCIWINRLQSNHLRPNIELIDEVPFFEWRFWEKHYISLYRSWGFDLKNSNCGGGGKIKHSQETKDKLSVRNRGYRHTEEAKRKISINHARYTLGKKMSLETKEKLRLSHLGQVSNQRIKVVQLSLDGQVIKIWDSFQSAGLITSPQSIKRNIAGIKGRSGFKWMLFENFKKNF